MMSVCVKMMTLFSQAADVIVKRLISSAMKNQLTYFLLMGCVMAVEAGQDEADGNR
jgi:hypothetical protein